MQHKFSLNFMFPGDGLLFWHSHFFPLRVSQSDVRSGLLDISLETIRCQQQTSGNTCSSTRFKSESNSLAWTPINLLSCPSIQPKDQIFMLQSSVVALSIEILFITANERMFDTGSRFHPYWTKSLECESHRALQTSQSNPFKFC